CGGPFVYVFCVRYAGGGRGFSSVSRGRGRGRNLPVLASARPSSSPSTAMLIARAVVPGTENSGAVAPDDDLGGKASLRGFAEHAGIGKDTVSRYLRTWQAMAEAGIVPAYVWS